MFSQLTLLAAVAIGVGIVLVLLVYILHRNVRRQLRGEEWKAPTPRAENSQAFVLATLQGVIAGLREEQKKTQDLLRVSELRAEDSARRAELLAREIEEGLLIFDEQGFLSLANPAAHALMGIDVWSRRRYQEVLGMGSDLSRGVEACLATGTIMRGEAVEYQSPRGETLRLTVTIVPLTRQGTGGEEISGAVCLLKKG
jgi:PAS domain-containing protein